MCTRPTAGLAIRLPVRLAIGYIASAIGVIGYTRALRAVLILLTV